MRRARARPEPVSGARPAARLLLVDDDELIVDALSVSFGAKAALITRVSVAVEGVTKASIVIQPERWPNDTLTHCGASYR